jgi:hypothetical protein
MNRFLLWLLPIGVVALFASCGDVKEKLENEVKDRVQQSEEEVVREGDETSAEDGEAVDGDWIDEYESLVEDYAEIAVEMKKIQKRVESGDLAAAAEMAEYQPQLMDLQKRGMKFHARVEKEYTTLSKEDQKRLEEINEKWSKVIEDAGE